MPSREPERMNAVESTFQEFVDAVQTAEGADAFELIATRLTQKLGFQRFAYLRLGEDAPILISSYPKRWTSRYFHLRYEQLDPVVLRARGERDLFSWGGAPRAPAGN